MCGSAPWAWGCVEDDVVTKKCWIIRQDADEDDEPTATYQSFTNVTVATPKPEPHPTAKIEPKTSRW